MDSYVVRIYRRDPKDPRKSVGIVEKAEGNGEQSFHDLEELMGILASSEPAERTTKPKSNGRKQ